MYALFQSGGNLLYFVGGIFGSKDNRDNGAELFDGLCCLRRGSSVKIYGLFWLRVTHNTVFLRHTAPLKLTLPLVAAFYDISVLGKRALFLLGGVFAKGFKVNAAFPFFGHIHHAGFIQIVVAQIAGRVYVGDMHKVVHVVGKVDNLSDILKAVFLL